MSLNGIACGEQGEPTETPTDPETSEPPTGGTPSALSVEGNELVDAEGATVVLNGFNRTGTEWPCIHGWGFVDGPVDDAAIEAITSWNPNAVRVPMNEQCWLGRQAYRDFIDDWVTRLTEAGAYVILDLHWNAHGTEQAEARQKMANTDHSIGFWESVAVQFKDNPAVLYDLYNESHDISEECSRTAGSDRSARRR
ncbi:cellulase family glycosylhydrolase [Glycomyces sp. YM15]|uniref:cellulase family glycosylhydrolase n=1 Tax=Glycomyces sp. YM15 TaxID=2800446 RepID=UPI0019625039|nr:cellulase family glycosylhydrolase [Glycomyces sp. YM15]